MRILIEIVLSVCEWFQECSIQRSARRAAGKSERKTVFTFLSQGAVGAALALFFMSAYSIIAHPSGYNIILVGGFVVYSSMGAIAGAVAGFFIWLVETSLRRLRVEDPTNPRSAAVVYLKRLLRFLARTITALVVMPSLLYAFFYLKDKRELAYMSYSYWLGFTCTTGLLIGLITGSNIRTCRAVVFGAGGRRVRRNAGSWLSIPFGFLLRALSVFALLESFLTLALWISNRRTDRDWFPVQEQLPGVVCAILYFAISSYLSLRTPRKRFLLPIAAALNLPLVAWIVILRSMGTENADFLAYVLVAFMFLWTLYTLGSLIAPESGWPVGSSMNDPRASRVTPGGECKVHL